MSVSKTIWILFFIFVAFVLVLVWLSSQTLAHTGP